LLASDINGCIGRGVFAGHAEPRMQRSVDTNTRDARLGAQMAAAQAGDRSAYRALLHDCIPLIRAVAARRAPPDRIDDIVQETLLTIHRARQTYDPRRSFTSWLTIIADRRAIDIMRQALRNGRREVHAPLFYDNHPDDTANPAGATDRSEAALQIGRALATLPTGQRQAVETLVLQEQSLAAAARQTGRSEGALKVNLHRALKSLRAKFERKPARS
jgi:RNA polymerase sigma factor (sigma-70 family)